MKKTNPRFIFDEKGKKTGVLLKISEFNMLKDEIEDYYDYKIAKSRSGKKEKVYSPEDVLSEILGEK